MYLPIFVAQYYVGHGPYGVRPYGWHVVVQTGIARDGAAVGTAYYVRGSTMDPWKVQVRRNVRYRTFSAYRGSARVGEVDARHLEALEYQMSRAEILDHDPTWNYQDWVCGALRRLHAQQFRVEPYVWEGLRELMKSAEDAYDTFKD